MSYEQKSDDFSLKQEKNYKKTLKQKFERFKTMKAELWMGIKVDFPEYLWFMS